jgi:hypothetical protein
VAHRLREGLRKEDPFMANDLLTRTSEGAAAGLAGTVAIQATALPGQSYLPDWHPPETVDPASFMLWQVEKHLPRKTWLSIPKKAETMAGFGLSFAYGAAFGAIYGAFCKARKRRASLFVDGTVVGLTCWAVGYLGWLPAAKVTPPPWKQDLRQMVGPVVEHVVYGIVTVSAYRLLNGKW